MALLGHETTVTGPFPDGVLLLETLAGTEELAALFAFDLHPLSADHEELAVGIKLDSADWRYFHGVVTSFAKVGTTRS